jgi:hypothetical protein
MIRLSPVWFNCPSVYPLCHSLTLKIRKQGRLDIMPIISTFLYVSALLTDRHMDFRIRFSMITGDIGHVLTFFANL